MGHLIFIILHILAIVFGFVLLFVTVPLHLIYAVMGSRKGGVLRYEPNPDPSEGDEPKFLHERWRRSWRKKVLLLFVLMLLYYLFFYGQEKAHAASDSVRITIRVLPAAPAIDQEKTRNEERATYLEKTIADKRATYLEKTTYRERAISKEKTRLEERAKEKEKTIDFERILK